MKVYKILYIPTGTYLYWGYCNNKQIMMFQFSYSDDLIDYGTAEEMTKLMLQIKTYKQSLSNYYELVEVEVCDASI